MNEPQQSFLTALKKPTAFIPLLMSASALSVVLFSVAIFGVDRKPADEGATAHIWQLLMAGQLPFIAVFAIRWLSRIPGNAIYVLALQIAAILTAMAPVFILKL
jgi:hypothetical protein